MNRLPVGVKGGEMVKRKALLGLLTLALCLAITGKDKEPLNLPYTDDGRIQYQETVEVPGVSTADLMKRAKGWVVAEYRSAPDVIKSETENQLVVKGLMDVGSWTVWHVLTIEAKDGRYRVTLSGFEVEWGPGKSTALDSDGYQKAKNEPRFGFRPLFAGVDSRAIATLTSLKTAMSKPAENW